MFCLLTLSLIGELYWDWFLCVLLLLLDQGPLLPLGAVHLDHGQLSLSRPENMKRFGKPQTHYLLVVYQTKLPPSPSLPLPPCQGAYSRWGKVRGAPPLSDLGGRRPPLDFQNLKWKSTVTPHSNRKRDKEEEGKKEYRFMKLWWPRKPKEGRGGGALFPPFYISLSPFLPIF